MGANNNDVAPFVTEWEVEDVDPDDIVVVRCAHPGDDDHTLLVQMEDGTKEYVWICKADKKIDREDRVLRGTWYKNKRRDIRKSLVIGAYDECHIEDNLDILCIYPPPQAGNGFQLQDLNREEVAKTLLARREKRKGTQAEKDNVQASEEKSNVKKVSEKKPSAHTSKRLAPKGKAGGKASIKKLKRKNVLVKE